MSNESCNDGCWNRRYVEDGVWRCCVCNECYTESFEAQEERLKIMQQSREEQEMGLPWNPLDEVN
jgi:hypothetical protein